MPDFPFGYRELEYVPEDERQELAAPMDWLLEVLETEVS